jgi:hypothetical protein
VSFTDFASSREYRLQSDRVESEERQLLSDLRMLAESGKSFEEVALQFTRIGGQLIAINRHRAWLHQQIKSESIPHSR